MFKFIKEIKENINKKVASKIEEYVDKNIEHYEAIVVYVK